MRISLVAAVCKSFVSTVGDIRYLPRNPASVHHPSACPVYAKFKHLALNRDLQQRAREKSGTDCSPPRCLGTQCGTCVLCDVLEQQGVFGEPQHLHGNNIFELQSATQSVTLRFLKGKRTKQVRWSPGNCCFFFYPLSGVNGV